MTILIAETSVHILKRLESLILEADSTLKVKKASTLAEALIMFGEFTPDVVLLNMDISATQSFDLIKHIKASTRIHCIIGLSMSISLNIREYCKRLGVDYFVDTHNEFDQIPDIIKACVEKAR